MYRTNVEALWRGVFPLYSYLCSPPIVWAARSSKSAILDPGVMHDLCQNEGVDSFQQGGLA